jgi:4a-hydroxytetrahydrobiopterin dehydratase
VVQIPEGWSLDGSRLVRRIELDGYEKVVVAGLAVSLLAIWRNHHPRLIVEYRSIVIELSSHDVGSVTDRDLDLASWVNVLIPPHLEG